jgi:hypothetical protein
MTIDLKFRLIEKANIIVGWANGSFVNPTFLASMLLGCQRDGSPTYNNNILTSSQ